MKRKIKTRKKNTNFYRSFHLPEDISQEGIEASFKNGILRLKIPKKTAKISEKQVIDIK
jgi:HSP20 family protein